MSKFKIIISGGGTGGHVFPALSIVGEIKHRFPEADILFVGAENRMEMERVPAAGYRIIGLPVTGFNRKHKLKNITVIFRLIKSLRIAKKIIRDFKPDIAIGVGGYASGPTLWMASSLHIPVVIQEQNSYAGLTNKLLGKRAAKICVAYKGMEKYFPEDRIVVTGNPVRKELELLNEQINTNHIRHCEGDNPKQSIAFHNDKSLHVSHNEDNEYISEAFAYFGLDTGKPVLLILGGSLGARTLNNSIRKGLKTLMDAGIQVIWQTGRIMKNNYELSSSFSDTEKITNYESKELKNNYESEELKGGAGKGLWRSDFISRMDYAYSVADLVVSRAGACTLSELCLLKKAALLVPSPNVAEDHQTKNARTLSDHNAAVLIPDREAEEKLVLMAIELLKNKERLCELSENITLFAQQNSAKRIVDEVFKIIT